MYSYRRTRVARRAVGPQTLCKLEQSALAPFGASRASLSSNRRHPMDRGDVTSRTFDFAVGLAVDRLSLV